MLPGNGFFSQSAVFPPCLAKLHGCYPRATLRATQEQPKSNFTSGQPKYFRALFFGAGPSPIQVAGDCFFFTSLQQRKKNFLFFLLYGYNT